MSFVGVASSTGAVASGVAGASLTGVTAGDGLVCFAVYQSVATLLSLTDSRGQTWGLWTNIPLTGAAIAVFVPVGATLAGTHTVTASFSGGGNAWTVLIEDTDSRLINPAGQKLIAPGAGNTLISGTVLGVAGGSIYQLAIDNTNKTSGYIPQTGQFSFPVLSTVDATAGAFSIVNDSTVGGTDPGMAPGTSDPTGADTYGVIGMGFAPIGMAPQVVGQVVLVTEDVGPIQRSRYPFGMFFNRSAQTLPAATPLAFLSIKTPPWEFYRDQFTSVYPVIEVYDQTTQLIPATNLFVLGFRRHPRLDQPEEELRRFDHQQYFAISRHYTAQLIGYTVDVPDFNDHPWLEWVHPPASPESALFAFRTYPITITRSQQFNLYFDQPRPWKVQAEEDSVFRKPDVGVLFPYGHPLPAGIQMPDLIGFDQDTAIGIILDNLLIYTGSVYEDVIYWPESPPTPWNPTGPFPAPVRGIVIGQWPLPGDSVTPNFTLVTLVVSSGRVFIPGVDTSTSGNVPNTVIGSTKFP